jgi:hypothetical protein
MQPDRCHPVGMGVGWVRQYWSSIGGLVSSIAATTWDQTWQTASVRERSVLARTIFAGVVAWWAAAVGLSAVFPAAAWFFYYGLSGGIYAWLGRSRSIADAPGRDSGVPVAVGWAKELGLDIPRCLNWTRDVFRTLPAADRANVGRLARWLDGPAGVVGFTAMMVVSAAISQQQRSDPVGVRVLIMIPVAFGVAAGQRVYLHRRSQRAAFAERVNRRSPAGCAVAARRARPFRRRTRTRARLPKP